MIFTILIYYIIVQHMFEVLLYKINVVLKVNSKSFIHS
jgi:hypothetical protein